MTLKAPPLAAFGRSMMSASHASYRRQLSAARVQATRNVLSAIPYSRISRRYSLVANGFAVVVPTADIGELAHIAGVAKVWPNLTYHSLAIDGPEAIGADKIWGAGLVTAGGGIKIGILDDGLDASHPYFDQSGFTYPAGFPKGQTRYATTKVIVQRAFPETGSTYEYANTPFDPKESFHATHVAGIAAGDNNTADGSLLLSGVAPKAYIGNYKVLTVPTPSFGLDGNSAAIAAGIEAAVADGMNVINLSLGEPEIEPSRDFVVHALNAAAAAGVVPVVAAGNDFGEFGFGSISSPANAAGAIAVAATTTGGMIGGFSSGGPTPVSLQLKPDLSAPGVGITSSVPHNQGQLWEDLSGTSMATPAVAGAAALLKQLHPTWTVPQIKSALVQTGDAVRDQDGKEVETTREGGGLINVPRANNPLLFAAPTAISFPVNGGARSVSLTDAGGGAGAWSVAVNKQQMAAGVNVVAGATVTIPGTLTVTATASAAAKQGDVTGFVVLTHGTDTRRIPFWVAVSRPVLGTEAHSVIAGPGVYKATTRGGPSKIRRYRYPTTGDVAYPGPEKAFRVTIKKTVANFGVAVLTGKAVPHVTYPGDENHLVGYTGLPQNLNPYFSTFGASRPIAGAVRPLPGSYDIVFDTPLLTAPGPFTYRYWVNDTTPPKVRATASTPGTISVTATDTGAGIDPASFVITLDGQSVNPQIKTDQSHDTATLEIRATAGTHQITVNVSDFQEAKNMEDVAAVAPNTAAFKKTLVVR